MQNATHQATPDVSVVVVSFNTRHLLEQMFRSLADATIGLSHEIIIIDNASSDGSAEWIQTNHPEVHLIVNRINVGFGRANNQAIPLLRGKHVLLLNTDAFGEEKSANRAIEFLDANSDAGLVGVRLIGRDNSLQPSCRYFPTPWNIFLNHTGLSRWFKYCRLVDDLSWDHLATRECDWVPGCFYMIRADIVRSIGLFDPRFFLYYEEVDHCLRVKQAGWKVYFLGSTSCVHLGGESAATTGKVSNAGRQISALQVESELMYFRKHRGLAGILLHLCLTILCDTILLGKSILKKLLGRTVVRSPSTFRSMLIIAKKTRLGTTPTR
jgi:GT2 family glycosyltransferase